MLLLICMLAISLNMDSFGVGISYGMRDIKIPFFSKVILCLCSIIYATVAMILGKWIVSFLPSEFSNIVGVSILIGMGLLVIIQSLFSNNNKKEKNKTDPIKIHIKPLQITIQIIRDPVLGDMDKSNSIDAKESLYLGIALSIDSLGAGIGIYAAGIFSVFTPFAIGICQIIFLSIGNLIGKKIATLKKISTKLCLFISGVILIVLGLIRLFTN